MNHALSRSEKIKDGESIVEEGTWAFYAYILKSGKAKVLKNIDDRPVLIRTLSKGDVFGEMAFLGGVKRTASVIADGTSIEGCMKLASQAEEAIKVIDWLSFLPTEGHAQ